MAVLGIDVSHYQGAIDWTKVNEAGYKFAYVKASEGAGYSDSLFGANMIGAKEAGVLVGPYHYFRLHSDPLAQAKWFVETVKPYIGKGVLQPALDFEEPSTLDVFRRGENAQTVIHAINVMASYIETQLKCNLTFYTYPYYFSQILGNPKGYGNRFALWLANYSRKPVIVGDWLNSSFWQFTPSAIVPGITGAVDANKFIGTYANLQKFCPLGAK